MIGLVIYAPNDSHELVQMGKPVIGDNRANLISQCDQRVRGMGIDQKNVYLITEDDMAEWKRQLDIKKIEEL